MFSQAQYEAVIGEIRTGLTTFGGRLDQVVPAAQAAVARPYVPPTVGAAVLALAHRAVEAGKEILNWIADLLKGAVAPIGMFIDSWRWMDVRGAANGVAADLSRQNLAVDDSDWSGRAREAYLTALLSQSAAAGRIGGIANSTSFNLLTCAAAGLAFYVALAAVLAKLIAATVAAIAALGSAVFSWAGLLLIIEEAGFTTAFIATATATLAAFLGAQATAMITLHGDAVDPAGFPGGVWPRSNTAQYSDATVKDGDADWSLRAK